MSFRPGAEWMLVATAAIWGFAFVAQVKGMEHVGPFTFNAARFALGALSLLPLVLFFNSRANDGREQPHVSGTSQRKWPPEIIGGLMAGLLLFAGATLQQVGLLYTTAANAGFITGLYVILVPVIGRLLGHSTPVTVWLGALLALGGLYALSIRDGLTLSRGDTLQLLGAFCWAGHVLLIESLTRRCNTLWLALAQYGVCAALSAILAGFIEAPELSSIQAAAWAIAYAGLLSVGVAYTLQILAQRQVPAARAAIIISLEGVFAALGGWWLLDQSLDGRAITGCVLMLSGMIVAQYRFKPSYG